MALVRVLGAARVARMESDAGAGTSPVVMYIGI